MRINISNAQKINAALKDVNGRSESFTIRDQEEVLAITKKAELFLFNAQLSESDWRGARFEFRPAGPRASGYKYAANSTRITIERGSKDWFLVSVMKDAVSPRESASKTLYLTSDHIEKSKQNTIARNHIVLAA